MASKQKFKMVHKSEYDKDVYYQNNTDNSKPLYSKINSDNKRSENPEHFYNTIDHDEEERNKTASALEVENVSQSKHSESKRKEVFIVVLTWTFLGTVFGSLCTGLIVYFLTKSSFESRSAEHTSCKETATRNSSGCNCPDGWICYGGSCYLFSGKRQNFTEAGVSCAADGAHLVYVDSFEENKFIQDLLKTWKTWKGYDECKSVESVSPDSVKDFWLGLSDLKHEGTWLLYGSNRLPEFVDWLEGEPNNSGNEDCAEFISDWDFQWNDTNCSHLQFSVCENHQSSAKGI